MLIPTGALHSPCLKSVLNQRIMNRTTYYPQSVDYRDELINDISKMLDDIHGRQGCILNLQIPSTTCEGEPETLTIVSLDKRTDGSVTVLSESYSEKRKDPLESYKNYALQAIRDAVQRKPYRLIVAVGELANVESFANAVYDEKIDLSACYGTEDELSAIRQQANKEKTGETLLLEYLKEGKTEEEKREETLSDALDFEIYSFPSKEEAKSFKKAFFEGFWHGANWCCDLQSRSRYYTFIEF